MTKHEHTIPRPFAEPSPPQHPRTFVTYSRDPLNVINYQIKVSLYWLPPAHPNGVVTSYVIYRAQDAAGPWDENAWEPANHIYLSNQSRADPDRVYYFKVRPRLPACGDLDTSLCCSADV